MPVSWDDFTLEQQLYIKEREDEYRRNGVNHTIRYVVEFDKYEMDNLLWLFNAIGYKVFPEHESFRSQVFQSLNTGDWNGQIPWKLKEAIDKKHSEWNPYKWSPNVQDKERFDQHIESTVQTYLKEKEKGTQ